MLPLFLFGLFCLLLAARLSGPFRVIPLLIASPVLLAVVGTVLMTELALSMSTALLLSCLALVALIGLPLLLALLATRRAEAIAQERRQRLAALHDNRHG